MDKLKKLFKKDQPSQASESAPKPSNTTPSQSQGGGSNEIAEGVILHTTLGDITIGLFRDQTPKVSHNRCKMAHAIQCQLTSVTRHAATFLS